MRPSAAGRRPVMLGQKTQRRHRPDYMLVVIATILLVLGLVVVYAISPGLAQQKNVSENYFVGKQVTAILIGIVSFLLAANVPLSTWRRWIRPLIFVAGAATITALILPVTPDYPAHRWIRFGGLSLQSVELIKFALLLWLAYFLSDRIREGNLGNSNLTFKPLLVVLGILTITVAIAQRDLGSTGVLVAMMGIMAFVAGMPMRRILSIGAIILVGTLFLISTSSYRRERVATFLQPEQDCQAAGYQACQALIAIGSGGLFGKGLAHSVQAYGYLPEAANDSIFAIFAEKFGFVGVSVLVGLFVAFFTRVKNIMERAPDNVTRLVLAGILAWLSTQALINIGAMVGLLPLKGITLPFISYGGTSIIFVMAALGVIFNISRYTTYSANSMEAEGKGNDSLPRGNTGTPARYSTRQR